MHIASIKTDSPTIVNTFSLKQNESLGFRAKSFYRSNSACVVVISGNKLTDVLKVEPKYKRYPSIRLGTEFQKINVLDMRGIKFVCSKGDCNVIVFIVYLLLDSL